MLIDHHVLFVCIVSLVLLICLSAHMRFSACLGTRLHCYTHVPTLLHMHTAAHSISKLSLRLQTASLTLSMASFVVSANLSMRLAHPCSPAFVCRCCGPRFHVPRIMVDASLLYMHMMTHFYTDTHTHIYMYIYIHHVSHHTPLENTRMSRADLSARRDFSQWCGVRSGRHGGAV